MESKPILFSTEMVRAILDGRKTQTRRIINLPVYHPSMHEKHISKMVIKDNVLFDGNNEEIGRIRNKYQVGDTLWVRETFCMWNDSVTYKADCSKAQAHLLKWKPSIFMPYDACRIFLTITNIRIEKIQSISNDDAKAEGATNVLKHEDLKRLDGMDWVIPRPFLEHQFGFMALWCKINGVQSWIDNPYVWVIEFKVKEVKNGNKENNA